MHFPSWPQCQSRGLDARATPVGPVILRAKWLLPHGGRPPIDDGAVLIEAGRIRLVGTFNDIPRPAACRVVDLGQTVLAPAFINAHTHTELCHLGAQRPEQSQGFADWVGWLVKQNLFGASSEDFQAALSAMQASGTFGLADIATRRPREVAAAMRRAGSYGLQTLEWFGHPALAPEGLDWPKGLPLEDAPDEGFFFAAAGHSLATTGFELLARAKAFATARGQAYCLHLAEHQGEVDLLADASGPFSTLMRERGLLPADFSPPGRSPVAQAQALGLLDARTLAVHCVMADADDIAILAQSRASVCLCPRSNALIGVGRPPVAAFQAAGVPLCLGTDSLASSPDLDVFAEAKFLADELAHAPHSPPEWTRLLDMLSSNAAKVLGLGGLLGQLEPGRPAVFAVLGLPHELADSPLSSQAADAT